MMTVIFGSNCVRCLLIVCYLVQCLFQQCAGFVSTLSDYTNSSGPVDSAKVTSNIFLLGNDSNLKPHLPSTEIPKAEFILKGPSTYLTNAETLQESQLFFASSQFMDVSSCNNTNNAILISTNNPCSTTVNDGQTTVDCSGLSQENINPAWFPTNTNVIILNNNGFTAIENCTFSHLRDLRNLSLSGNIIRKIYIYAFSGLHNLESLNLEDNKLGDEYLNPPNVFKPLTKLKELLIQNNIEESSKDCLPGNVLGTLTQLTSLSVDTVGYRLCFMEQFARLAYLQHLKIVLNAKYIDESSFENVRQITELYLRSFIVTNFSQVALEPLQKLDVLHFDGVHTGVENSLLALKPFQGRKMTVIYFDSLNMFEQDSYAGFIKNDGVLTLSKTRYLLEICVREFTLKHSEIYVIQGNAFSSDVWDRCLVKLDLSRNPILGSKTALMRMLNFKNLEIVKIDEIMQRCFFKTPVEDLDVTELIDTVATSSENTSTVANGINYYGTTIHNTNMNKEHSFRSNKQSVTTELKKRVVDTCISYQSPPKYLWIAVSNSLQRIHLQASLSTNKLDWNVKFIGATSLTHLDVSRGKLYKFQGNITGLDALQTLILSGNDLSILSETFFDSFCHLEVLLLSDASLDVDFISRKSDRLLMNLWQLKRLDLSINLLNSLAVDTFTFNRDLEMLNLAKNRFSTIPFNLGNTPNLKFLDIRKNSVSSIERNDRDVLDILAKQPGGFKMFLSGNDISCDCNNFPFLHWLTTTQIQLDVLTIPCFDDNNNTTNFVPYMDVDRFFRKCLSGLFLTAAIGLFLLMVIGFLALFFVRKHKIFLKSVILKIFTGFKLKEQSDYETGVYIGYSEHEYAFPCFPLRRFIEDDLSLTTYLYHRDGNGPDMARNIVNAINSSWRIILVVNGNFLYQDEWSTFTYTSAICSQTSENPSRIVVLVESSLQHHLPAEILSAVNDDNIIVVPQWELNYELRHQLRSRLIH